MTLRQFLLFTAVTVPACGLCILFLDQPLALFIRANFGWLAPFFGELTSAADAVHDVLMTRLLGIPFFFLLLGAAFVVGRYVLRRPQATLFLILLLTHEFSMVTAKVLKGVVHRLRPEVLFDSGYAGTGLWQPGPHNDSFPSTHTAVYFSLFWPLAVAFPRWQKPLLVLPVLIGLGRMVLGAHYLGDVWASIWLVVAFTFLFGLLGVPRNVLEAPVLHQDPAEEEVPVLQK